MTSYFFLNTEFEISESSSFIEKLQNYAETKKKQLYVVDRPLTDGKYNYLFKEVRIILCPKHKIQIINFNNNNDKFSYFLEDLKEDIASISDKFKYKEIIGRPRSWSHLMIDSNYSDLKNRNIDEIINNLEITDELEIKKIDLLISLFIGSINDVDRVKDTVPNNLLDKIKQKIQLFDGDQTRFIYEQSSNKRIIIQGLSGTGKTELLLHKLKELYVREQNSTLFFTCHNKILADYLRNRIPSFFNFLKVEQQIEWEKRLWCTNAWGSIKNANSGAYRYICDHYNLTFRTFSYFNTFDNVCLLALKELKTMKIPSDKRFAFTYMFIDESQDFTESFFKLCEFVTEKRIYIAGDIFQSIFDDFNNNTINPDFLLGKCFRTDPKTLMFAHALGMGLFENIKFRWLEDKEWLDCGYSIQRESNQIILSREPVRRFEDVDEDYESIKIIYGEFPFYAKIIEIIKDIFKENPSAKSGDIAIIFLDSDNIIYSAIDTLKIHIQKYLSCEVNIAYETKHEESNKIFISNRNNVKGLEFPFVICVTKQIKSYPSFRNLVYTMLTRSFLKSYLVINQKKSGITNKMIDGLYSILQDKKMIIKEPSENEKARIRTNFKTKIKRLSVHEMLQKIFRENNIEHKYQETIFEITKKMDLYDIDEKSITDYVLQTYSLIKK